jgi:hypothetical protein
VVRTADVPAGRLYDYDGGRKVVQFFNRGNRVSEPQPLDAIYCYYCRKNLSFSYFPQGTLMKRSSLVWFLGALLLTVAPALTFGQDEVLRAAAGDKYVISAKAGGVNHVSGTVTVARRDKRYGRLINGDSVEVGDRVATGVDGRVELLLNPGSYVRLGANSEFEFVSTSLDDLSLKIYRG